MKARSILGWVVAAVVGLSWLGSGEKHAPSSSDVPAAATKSDNSSTIDNDTPGLVQDSKPADPVPLIAP